MSQQKAYNRLLELALVLTDARGVGVRTDDLIARLGYDSGESGKRTLIRDLDDLRASGLEIDNTADPGEEARYVIRPGDVRLRVEFTPAQRTALQSALAAASAQGLVAVQRKALPVDLDRPEAQRADQPRPGRGRARTRGRVPPPWRPATRTRRR